MSILNNLLRKKVYQLGEFRALVVFLAVFFFRKFHKKSQNESIRGVSIKA